MKLLTPHILDIFNGLKPYKSMLVGGCVRDFLYNNTLADDIDIATTATPEVVIEKLTTSGMKMIPTGLKHGTVTCIYKNKPYEITTLRKDTKTNGRHAEVVFTDDFHEDSLRRDFTFNALYMDAEGQVYDFHQGQKDLKDKKVRFIGDTQSRIQEDYLRILRYFRFHGNFEICPQFNVSSLKVIQENVHHIQNLSKERITAEVFKILKNPHTSLIWKKMNDVGVLSKIGLEQPHIKHLENLEEKNIIHLSFLEKLVCLHPYLKFEKTLFSYSNQEKKVIKNIQNALIKFQLNQDIYQQGYILGKSSLESALKILIGASHNTLFETYFTQLQNWQKPIFPLSGQDLIQKGLQPNPYFGEILKTIEIDWVKNNFPNKEWCINQLKNIDK
jgi:poly(A) polymerase